MIYIFCRVIDILFMFLFFFFNDTATTEIYTLSLHDALPIFQAWLIEHCGRTGADLRRAGKNGLRGIARFADADTSADDTFTRILPSPRHVPIVVAGARNPAVPMVVRVFGGWAGRATKATK